MDESAKVLEFLCAIQHIALDPDTYGQSSEVLDNRYRSLVKEESLKGTANNLVNPKIHTSVTYAIFGSSNHTFTQNNGATTHNRLKVCKLQTDELLLGWRSRMRKINCLENDTSVDQLISKLAGLQISNPEEPDFVKNAATLLGMSKEVLIQKHTLSAFFNVLEGLRPSKLANKSLKHKQAYQRCASFRLGNKTLRYCAACAEKDFSTLGYSYWRCSHQLPGILWCSQHDNLLYKHSVVANLQSPHEISNPNIHDLTDSLTPLQTQILKKYAQIAYELHSYSSVIDSGAASVALGKQAKANNFSISKPSNQVTPSTYIIKTLPDWWLVDTFPRVKWLLNKYIWTIDGACVPGASRYTTSTLCLLAALLYENKDDALVEIFKPREIIEERGFDYWAKKEIFDQYIASRGVVSRIAEKLSLPHSTVGLGLLNQGLPGLGKAASTTLAALDFFNGKTLQEACVNHQASVKDTSNLIRASCSKIAFALNKICNESSPTGQLEKCVEKKQVTG